MSIDDTKALSEKMSRILTFSTDGNDEGIISDD